MSMINTLRAIASVAIVSAATVFTTANAMADSFERWVYINNVGEDFIIEEVHLSHVDDPWWGPNLISGTEVYPGEYVQVDPISDDGYCRFDVLLVLDDGYEITLPGVNLCEATDIYTDGYEYDVQYI